jgi:uncharacterized RDD family membrane protein YckC
MTAAPARPKVYPFRRFFARLFDCLIAELLVFWAMELWLGLGRGSGFGLSGAIAAGVLLLLAEAAFLLMDVPMPGKWLFGIRVLPESDSKLSVWRAFDRGFTATTIGMGCYLPIVGWYAGVQSYWRLMETGTTVWDRGKFSVVHDRLRWWRFLVAGAGVAMMFVIIVLTLAMLQRL